MLEHSSLYEYLPRIESLVIVGLWIPIYVVREMLEDVGVKIMGMLQN
jgi:hypothetical protein